MTLPAIIPQPIPDARTVDRLRELLPVQFLPLESIRTLLAATETQRPTDSDVAAALRYLEKRGEVVRVQGRGWRRVAAPTPGLFTDRRIA